MASQARKQKLKWTEPMNQDLLECKKKAKEIVASENAPVGENGRKKGYIEVMKDIWDHDMGYGHLNLKRQNLCDQASRIEKLRKRSGSRGDSGGMDSSQVLRNMDEDQSTSVYSTQVQEDESLENNSQNANSNIITNLHFSASQASAEDARIEDHSDDNRSVPGGLPDYAAIDKPRIVTWGRNNNGDVITISSAVIDESYNEIVTWRKNTFLVPYGKTGRDLIDQLTKHINDWNNGTALQHIALKAAIVLLAVALQKPSQKSKAKQHQQCLEKRMELWKNGEIECLVREGKAIQRRLQKSKQHDPPNKAKIFAKLIMEGQINSALRFLSENSGGGVLPLTDDVMKQLHEKHPNAKEANLGSLLFGPVEDIPGVIYQQIDGDMIREAALRTKGSGGPSGIDANGFRRLLACKSFKASGTNLCDALAALTRKLCTEYVDPASIEPLLANRLIPLDKGEGQVRPIGVGEVIRRIMGKCVTKVTKLDVISASGSLQVCAGHTAGGEAAIHAMREIFEADETDAALLIDATNAFNSLNRAAALHNIRVLCPTIAIYAINTYRSSARLVVTGGKELESSEGTTQGDPLAMCLYAIGLQPLITHLNISSSAKQCWYADDATGAGTLEDLKEWWEELEENGPALGYFPNAKKCWLIVKPEREDKAREIFAGTAINITTEGQRHLGAALGSRSYLESYVSGKVEGWVNEITKLAEFAVTQPQACYSAYTLGLKHKWTYYLRTLPDISGLLQPLERAIAEVLIPSITEHHCSPLERDLLDLPLRMGGLGLGDPARNADKEYEASVATTRPLVNQIVGQAHEPPDETEIKSIQRSMRREKDAELRQRQERLKETLPERQQRMMELATEKGSSNWLSVIPLKDQGYDLNKREFRDAIRLRYDWDIPESPSVCVCGSRFTVDHAMVCKRGGFIIQRHNELRDLEAELLDMVCYDVEIEPGLQPVTGEELNRGANQATDARLDVHARGFWERQRSAYFDIRVCHPNAASYLDRTPRQIYKQQEDEKKRKYAVRVMDIEQGTFTPLVFSTTGGMGEECYRFHSRLAELLAIKKGETYATTMSWIRARVSFALLRGALVCLRGSRGRKRIHDIRTIDLELENGLALAT